MAGPTEDPALHEGLTGVDPDLLGGKLGADFRTARDFAKQHPIPKDGQLIEVTLSGGGAVDEVEHSLGREPTMVMFGSPSAEIDLPKYVKGEDLSSPKPNKTHFGLENSGGAATIKVLVF